MPGGEKKGKKISGSFHSNVLTSILKDGKNFQDVWLENPKALIQQDA